MTDTRLLPERVPFGQYRGLPIDYLLRDYGYLKWCLTDRANWIRTAHPEFWPVLLDKGHRVSGTPSHNELQGKFDDELYCQAFCQVARA